MTDGEAIQQMVTAKMTARDQVRALLGEETARGTSPPNTADGTSGEAGSAPPPSEKPEKPANEPPKPEKPRPKKPKPQGTVKYTASEGQVMAQLRAQAKATRTLVRPFRRNLMLTDLPTWAETPRKVRAHILRHVQETLRDDARMIYWVRLLNAIRPSMAPKRRFGYFVTAVCYEALGCEARH